MAYHIQTQILAMTTSAQKIHATLDAAIAENDTDQVFEVLNDAFFCAEAFKPTWLQLKAAALKDNKSIVRLLLNWGAEVDEVDATHLPRIQSNQQDGTQALKLLTLCGAFKQIPAWKEQNTVVEKATSAVKKTQSNAEEKPPYDISKLPAEWLKVLQVIHGMGSKEAVIAGGALRDTFNQRAVRDVDIFLANPSNGLFQNEKQEKFLKNLFEGVGLEVHEQHIGYHGYGNVFVAKFPKPISHEIAQHDYDSVFKSPTNSWRIVAGPKKTEYNITFIEKRLGDDLKAGYVSNLLRAFDIGICQIGTDGKRIFKTSFYENDTAKKQIEVWQENLSCKEHLKKIIKKYPDYIVGKEAKKILDKKEKTAHYYSS